MDYKEFLSKFDKYTVELGYLQIQWVTGGMTGGSCWEDSEADTAINSDPEPEFTELDEVLEKICPQITFMQYKRINKKVTEISSDTSYEYYGNYTNYTRKTVQLRKLYDTLCSEGLL